MKDFFGKIFGKKEGESSDVKTFVADNLEKLLQLANLELSFDLEYDRTKEEIVIDLYGPDEEALTTKDGQLLDAFQLYVKRVLQHNMPEDKTNIVIDCGGFREQTNQSLIELVDRLKAVAVSKGRPVFIRALPPRDRKVVHQYLAEDAAVTSRSVGEGLFKKIKISPTQPAQEKESQAGL